MASQFFVNNFKINSAPSQAGTIVPPSEITVATTRGEA